MCVVEGFMWGRGVRDMCRVEEFMWGGGVRGMWGRGVEGYV